MGESPRAQSTAASLTRTAESSFWQQGPGAPSPRPRGGNPFAAPCRRRRENAGRVLPSLSHAAWSGVSEPLTTLLDSHQWPCLASFPCFPRIRAPSLDRHCPASSVLQGHPPPCRPGLPLAGFRSARARRRQGFPCCLFPHLPCMPAPLPRRKQADARVARFSTCRRPSPHFRRVGFRINRFEACSAFTRVPACMVAEPPKAALLPECFNPFRCLHEPPWLLPTGTTVVGRVSHPPERSALPRRTEVRSNCQKRMLPGHGKPPNMPQSPFASAAILHIIPLSWYLRLASAV